MDSRLSTLIVYNLHPVSKFNFEMLRTQNRIERDKLKCIKFCYSHLPSHIFPVKPNKKLEIKNEEREKEKENVSEAVKV